MTAIYFWKNLLILASVLHCPAFVFSCAGQSRGLPTLRVPFCRQLFCFVWRFFALFWFFSCLCLAERVNNGWQNPSLALPVIWGLMSWLKNSFSLCALFFYFLKRASILIKSFAAFGHIPYFPSALDFLWLLINYSFSKVVAAVSPPSLLPLRASHHPYLSTSSEFTISQTFLPNFLPRIHRTCMSIDHNCTTPCA